MTGHLNPVRWLAADIEGTILLAAGARHGDHIVTADGTLAPYDPATVEPINDSTTRFRITRSGPAPMLEGPIEQDL